MFGYGWSKKFGKNNWIGERCSNLYGARLICIDIQLHRLWLPDITRCGWDVGFASNSYSKLSTTERMKKWIHGYLLDECQHPADGLYNAALRY